MTMRPADYAWLSLAAGVVTWEMLCPPDELLSQAMDRYRATRPVIVHLGVIYIAAHLLRRWPRRADPLHRLANSLGKT